MSNEMVPFTDNYSDLSNPNGYQFEFFCERCGNGYRSPFVPDVKEKGRGMLRAASGMFGGRLSSISHAADALTYDRGTNSKAKDKALVEAVEKIRPKFEQCRGCGNWVCADVCWNAEVGQCSNCSPFVAEEVSRAQAAAQVQQIHEKARTVDWTKDLDLTTRAKVTCGACGAKVEGGKFCTECGEKLSPVAFCTNCGAEMKMGAKFCSECGERV
jgi:hypothetical protein